MLSADSSTYRNRQQGIEEPNTGLWHGVILDLDRKKLHIIFRRTAWSKYFLNVVRSLWFLIRWFQNEFDTKCFGLGKFRLR